MKKKTIHVTNDILGSLTQARGIAQLFVYILSKNRVSNSFIPGKVCLCFVHAAIIRYTSAMVKRIAILLGAAFLLFTFWYYQRNPLTTKITIGNHVLYVDVAATPVARERGLSGRTSLAQDYGMLFVFPAPAKHGFWMRGMNFALDFIWIRDKTVYELTRNVPAPLSGQSPNMLEPYYPIDMVLEVNAGSIDRFGIKQGDKVVIRQ